MVPTVVGMHPSHLAQLADDHRRDLLATADRARLARSAHPERAVRWWRRRRRARDGAAPIVIVVRVAPVAPVAPRAVRSWPVPAPAPALVHRARRPCPTRRR